MTTRLLQAASASLLIWYQRPATSWALLFDWVENNVAPGKSVTVTAGEKSLPLCSYPEYPRYRSGTPASASSYECAIAERR